MTCFSSPKTRPRVLRGKLYQNTEREFTLDGSQGVSTWVKAGKSNVKQSSDGVWAPECGEEPGYPHPWTYLKRLEMTCCAEGVYCDSVWKPRGIW